MTETPVPYGDPLSAPFWEAARRHELVLQQCTACDRHQFYPRPFCIRCDGSVSWVPATGNGHVHSITVVHLAVSSHLTPPYQVALVDLDEGPRLLGNIMGEPAAIGDRVAVSWLDRPPLPPLVQFVRWP